MERKTNKQKQVQGTLEKSRIPKMSLKQLHEIPEPFFKLDKYGLSWFNYMCSVLMENELLSAAWIPDITAAAWLWSKFMENVLLVDELGTIQTAKTGYRQKAPELTNATGILDDLRRQFLKSYGLTPIDMEKVPKMVKDEKKSLDDLINR